MKTKILYTEIYNKDRLVYSMNKPEEKVILWQVTSRCNQNCKYCYRTFDKDPHKKDYPNNTGVKLTKMIELVDSFKDLGFSKAYICGGEALLCKNIVKILEHLHKISIKSFLTTNLSIFPKPFENIFCEDKITSLIFSLDSLRTKVNNYVRGNTASVIEHATSLVRLKQTYSLNTEVGVAVVVSKSNIFDLKEIINWAKEFGLDFISLNLVFLPESHKFYKKLAITKGTLEYDKYLEMLSYLKEKVEGTKIRIPGDVHRVVVNHSGDKYSVSNCFCEQGHYLYIKNNGDVNVCPCKTTGEFLGNIKDKPLINIIPTIVTSRRTVCRDFSLHCLGIWETAYPKTATNS
jgi:MoaA/NifB/PqqE/SkfB family radical SAM enzyme